MSEDLQHFQQANCDYPNGTSYGFEEKGPRFKTLANFANFTFCKSLT
jgi:hypothetical protein